MSNPDAVRQHVVAVSTSESPDMAVLGLSDGHLCDAMTEIARRVLNFGSRLVYGGDLRQHGFSDLLFEIAARHHPVVEAAEQHFGVTNYLDWLAHIGMSMERIEAAIEALAGTAELVCMDMKGEPLPMRQRRQVEARQATEAEWSEGLMTMRQHMLENTDARIVLGGRIENYMGAMPGIAEEALLTLQDGQPLFVVGGFGGCTRDIAENLHLVEQQTLGHRVWPGREELDNFSAADLNYGLSAEDNATLARTPHIDQAEALILHSLLKVTGTGRR
ncbi:MAG: hypothetical protein OXI01_14140 [Albidovulum sp.]|nr:hypothetical protein [Albidovulum sp.]